MTQTLITNNNPSRGSTLLSGRVLWIARFLWIGLAILIISLYILDIPEHLAPSGPDLGFNPEFLMFNEQGEFIFNNLNPEGASAQAGIRDGDILIRFDDMPVHADWQFPAVVSNTVYNLTVRRGNGTPHTYQLTPTLVWGDWLFHALPIFGGLIYGSVGLLIFGLRSNDGMAMLVSFFLISSGVPAAPWVLHRLGLPSMFFVLSLFPNGRFIPTWTQYLTIFGVLFFATYFLPAPLNPETWPNSAEQWVHLPLFGLALVGQIYRYRQAESQERQQMLYVLSGLFILILVNNGLVILLSIPAVFDFLVSPFWFGYRILRLIQQVVIIIPPIMFAFSILRYKLWDIDIVINRALVYSGATTILGLFSMVSLTAVTYLMKELFPKEQSSLLSVIVSAMPVAAAFNPIRHKLQALVDQYFKPEEINFKGTFVEFTPELLPHLNTAELLKVLLTQVRKQLQVTQVAVYLKQADGTLTLADALPADNVPTELFLPTDLRAQLEAAMVSEITDQPPYEILVPLTLARARLSDFVGLTKR